MGIIKKIRKLKKNPRAFFLDSRNPVTSFVGNAIWQFPKKESQTINKELPKPAASQIKKSSKQSEKKALAQFELDLWALYRNEPFRLATSENQLILIYPTGVLSIDSKRARFFRQLGYRVDYLPLWRFLSQSQDIDDLEYATATDVSRADYIAKNLIQYAADADASAIVLPYDGTSIPRSIAVLAQSFEIKTICYFLNCSGLLKYYSEKQIASVPVCDFLLAYDEFARECIHVFPDKVLKEFLIIPTLTQNAMDTNYPPAQLKRLRARLGIGPSDKLVLFAAPPFQLGDNGKDIEAVIDKEFAAIFECLCPTDHLILIVKYRKKGLLPKSVLEKIKKHYRQSTLYYHDELDLGALISISYKAVLPTAIASDYGQPSNVHIYDTNINTEYTNDKFMTFSQLAIKQEMIGYGDDLSLFEKKMLGLYKTSHLGFDVIAVPDPISNGPITNGRQKYLLELLGANKRVYGAGNPNEAIFAEAFLQWGAEPSESKSRPEILRSLFARQRLYVEDGFIRSHGLWTDPNEPTLSIVFDTRAIYYDALRPSLLEILLNSDFEVPTDQITRVQKLIHAIVRNRISKYNHMPNMNLDFRSPNKRTILLIDQKVGDLSIGYGAANDETFFKMLDAALSLGDDAQVVIKQHPCAISEGPHQAHFTAKSLGSIASQPNVHLIAFDINPYALIEAVDEVWVITSGMGFEALMARKPVRCFGAPFYASWGVTHDSNPIQRRKRKRSVEEIFYFFYILLSRYINPDTGKRCEIEQLIDYFALINSTKGSLRI